MNSIKKWMVNLVVDIINGIFDIIETILIESGSSIIVVIAIGTIWILASCIRCLIDLL